MMHISYYLFFAFTLSLSTSLSGSIDKEKTEFLFTKKIQKEITELVKDNPNQLSEEEYSCIAKKLLKKAPCNMLVFGLGKDSSLWIKLNKGGKTVFLEDNSKWFKRIRTQIPQIDAHLVSYQTTRGQWMDFLRQGNEQALWLEIPKALEETKWDIIFVDGPAGWSDEQPGRMKSIYTAAKLARQSKGCTVFVHDVNREVESVYSTLFLYDENLILTKDRLAHFYIP